MSRMTGAQFLADTLAGYGVTHIFQVPAILRRTMAELERRTNVARITTHSEKSAAYMADGYARASGRPGICMAQIVGALNLAAGLRDAWLAHSPVLAFTGGRNPKDKFRGVYQEVDDIPAFEPYTKWNATIDDVQRFPDMVRQAFRVATTGCPGPVHLQFLGNEGYIDLEEAEFDVLVEEDFKSVPPFRPAPELARVRKAVERVMGAERPVFVAGGGVQKSGARDILRRLAEVLQIPVATSLNGKDSIPGNHPLSVGVVGTYSRKTANRVVSEADLVVFVGTTTGGMTTHFWKVPPIGAPAIQIDIDPEGLGRNYPLEVAICGDAKTTLEMMLEAVGTQRLRSQTQWLARVQNICDEWKAEFEPFQLSANTPIRPERICHDLTRFLPDDAIVVVDTGHAGMWMGGMFDLTSPNQSYLRSAGHLGWTFPAGLGAKCACPDRPVVSFTGDLGFWYHIGDIETAARWGINAVTIVNNNRSGNQSMRGFARAYEGAPTEKSRELWVYNDVNFARAAEEMGALGIRVEKPSEFEAALLRALSSDRPTVIDVVTDIEAMAPLAWDPTG